MKKTMKLAGLLLAIVMVLSMMSVVAFAGTAKTITVTTPTGSAGNEVYHAYKILDITTYTGDTDADTSSTDLTELKSATYKIATKWAAFFATGADGLKYFDVDPVTGEVTKKDTFTDAAALAADAAKFIADNSIAFDATSAAVSNGKAVIDVTTPGDGYYFVDSTVGTLCMIYNNAPNVAFSDKNNVPTVEKTVASITERYSAAETDDTTTVTIGDVVNYSAVIGAKKGAENYVFHDTMDPGLTFSGSVVVKNGTDTVTAGTDTYTLTTPGSDCTFEVIFAKAFLDTLTDASTITIEYSATVNENAVLDDDGISNTAVLKFGENNNETSTPSTVTVNTYSFDLVKTDESKNVITGAEFKLYDAATGGNEIKVVKVSDGQYRLATSTENGVVIEAGEATIDGLGAGTYYLEETKQPQGYNLLNERKPVTIESANLVATVTDNKWVSGGIQIVNKQGAVLPETGGAGTTVIYMLGTVMVLGAAVLFVSKKRMGAAE